MEHSPTYATSKLLFLSTGSLPDKGSLAYMSLVFASNESSMNSMFVTINRFFRMRIEEISLDLKFVKNEEISLGFKF